LAVGDQKRLKMSVPNGIFVDSTPVTHSAEQAVGPREQLQRCVVFYNSPVVADAYPIVGEDGSEAVGDTEHGAGCEGITERGLDRSFCRVINGG